jgi:3,4-dihydroxy 2-butanone 4-phosphate synthase/GTP cyclohydrolase II
VFSPIADILDELRQGRMVVLTDDEDRENEGDLVLPAQFVTPESITFMLREAKGYLCLSLTESDCGRLDLHPQSGVNTSARGTAFTVSIDGHPRHGFTTGVSAKERARCIQMAIDPRSVPADFVRPGHINPLRSRDGGVLVRTGQTEGSIDLCRLAGLHPAAVIIEIMRDDGEMARVPDLELFCKAHGLKMCSVAQIIQHRLSRESLVSPVGTPREIRTEFGPFRAQLFKSLVDPLPHLALTLGDVASPSPEPVLVRMHRGHLLGDVFTDLDAKPGAIASGTMLRESMRLVQRAGRGAIVYLRSNMTHGAGDSLEEALQSLSPDATREDPRDQHLDRHLDGAQSGEHRQFGVGGQILRHLGITNLALITNQTLAMPALEAFGITIARRVRIDLTTGAGL